MDNVTIFKTLQKVYSNCQENQFLLLALEGEIGFSSPEAAAIQAQLSDISQNMDIAKAGIKRILNGGALGEVKNLQ